MIVTGRITDKADGKPLYGANIVAIGSNGLPINRATGGVIGTSTGPDGRFQLNDAPTGTRLRITYVGYNPVEITVHSTINVQLTTNNELPEAIVEGQKKKSNKWGLGLLAALLLMLTLKGGN